MPPNDPPAPPKPPAADPAAGKSVPSPPGAKVAPSARPPTVAPRPFTGLSKPGAAPAPPRPASAIPPAAPPAAPATNALPPVPAPPKLPSIPAPAPLAASAAPPPAPVVPSNPPPANAATNVSPSVPPKAQSIPAPPPTIDVEEKSMDLDLAAIGLGDAAERARLAKFTDAASGTNSGDDAAPRSRRIGETDIPPPAHVDTERAPGAKDPYIGTTFDHRYKIEKLLGEGGMGFVYLARHKVIDKKVAVKVLRAEMAKDREILERFLQEARAASSIGNPHIIDISDFGDLPDGSTYFVMEFLDGQSLVQFNDKNNRQPFEIIAKISIQMANGLAAAHEAGIIHRDLKPENIFIVTRGLDKHFVKILDFGIAKVATSGENKLTRAGAVFGTPHYMSPEQAAGSPLDHRTDIYSLGVMMYEMVSGALPFTADNFMGILSQHMYQAPPPLGKLNLEPQCPAELEAIIFKCLSKVPDDRYPDMLALSADLQRFQDGQVPEAVAQMASRPEGLSVGVTPDKPKKSPWLRLVAVGAAVMGATLGTVLVIISGPSGNPTPSNSAGPVTSAAPTATAVAKAKVVVIVEPLSAVATANFGGKRIKFPDEKVEVELGKSVTLVVEAAGFESQKVTIDGKTDIVRVKLVPLAGTAPVPSGPEPPTTNRPSSTNKPGPNGAPTTTTSATKPPGGSDVVDLYGPGQPARPPPTP